MVQIKSPLDNYAECIVRGTLLSIILVLFAVKAVTICTNIINLYH